ncbi:MAG: IS91 family transposase, partial [Gammaproteobacteria bacterium]|nr:IS91 family transposase [Gammaproteobacteria bacterium]
RALVTPGRRGRSNKTKAPGPEDATPVASHAAMSWAQRLKRVFDIEIETCSVCGGSMKVIAAIEDPVVIKKILTHLRGKGLYPEAAGLPQSRAPPQGDLFS